MMKLKLIFPRFHYPSGDPPLGIAYIAAFLRKKGYDVDIVDTTFERKKNLIKRLRGADGYGIYCSIGMVKEALEIGRICKLVSGAPVVYGGPLPSVEPLFFLRKSFVDAVVIGEGEKTMEEIVERNFEFGGVKGVWYKEKGKIVKQRGRKPICDLDSLPFPARDLLPMETYIKNWYHMDIVLPKPRGTNIIASRGCPFNCSYCQPTLRKIFGRGVRSRSPQNVVEELKEIKEEYSLNSFFFQDDTLCVDLAWTKNLCEEMMREKVNMFWGCNIRVDLVNKEILKLMVKAGLRKICIGIECYSDRIREKVYNKSFKRREIEKAVKIAKRLGIKIQAYFMLGAPGETVKEMKKTLEFANKLDVDEATFSITTPLPGTHLYQKFHSMLKNMEEMDYYKKYPFEDERESTVKSLRKVAYFSFYLDRKRVWKSLKILLNPFLLQRNLNKLRRL